ncbi:DNA recombination/repair protein RecA, partial [Staphylococcus pseudintermedius]
VSSAAKRGTSVASNSLSLWLTFSFASFYVSLTITALFCDYSSFISYWGIMNLGVEYYFVYKAGAWYSYNGEHMGQGTETVEQFLV